MRLSCLYSINIISVLKACYDVLSILSIFLFLFCFLCLPIPSLTFPCRCWHTHSASHPHSCSKQFHLPTSYWCHDHPWEPAYYSCLSYMSSVIHVQNVGKSPFWRCSKQKNLFLPLVFDHKTMLRDPSSKWKFSEKARHCKRLWDWESKYVHHVRLDHICLMKWPLYGVMPRLYKNITRECCQKKAL